MLSLVSSAAARAVRSLSMPQGIVTLDGKPLPNATVTFSPTNGQGSPAYGVTDAMGHYTLNFHARSFGCHAWQPRCDDQNRKIESGRPSRTASRFRSSCRCHESPSQPGELTADVNSEKEEYNFDLASE